ncbi:MAG: hypothetical protein AAF772_13105 [Acidobacteriota bacterium]
MTDSDADGRSAADDARAAALAACLPFVDAGGFRAVADALGVPSDQRAAALDRAMRLDGAAAAPPDPDAAALRQQLSETERTLERTRVEITLRDETLATAAARHQALEARVAELETAAEASDGDGARLANLQAQVDDAHAHAAAAHQEATRAEEALQRAREEAQAADTRARASDEAHDAARADVEDMQRRLGVRELERDERQRHIEQLEGQLALSADEYKRLGVTVQALRKERDRLFEGNRGHDGQLDELRAERDMLRQTLATARRERDALRSAHEQLRAEAEQHRIQFESTAAENDRLAAMLDALESGPSNDDAVVDGPADDGSGDTPTSDAVDADAADDDAADDDATDDDAADAAQGPTDDDVENTADDDASTDEGNDDSHAGTSADAVDPTAADVSPQSVPVDDLVARDIRPQSVAIDDLDADAPDAAASDVDAPNRDGRGDDAITIEVDADDAHADADAADETIPIDLENAADATRDPAPDPS